MLDSRSIRDDLKKNENKEPKLDELIYFFSFRVSYIFNAIECGYHVLQIASNLVVARTKLNENSSFFTLLWLFSLSTESENGFSLSFHSIVGSYFW